MNTSSNIAPGASASKRYRFSAMTTPEVTLDIFDEIDDWWGYGVPTLSYELSKLNASQALTVRIHSPGGSVTEGLGIRNLLRAYPGELTTVGVGFVASIASVILLAGKKVKMADNAYLMIHRPFGGVMGTADEMKRTAATLENMDENLLDIYVQAINSRGKGDDGTREKVWDWMQNETWFTAREALEAGFIDEVIGAEEIPDANTAATFTALARYTHVPAAIISQNQDEAMSKNLLQQIRALLIEEDAPQAQAVQEAQQADAVADPIEEARKLLEQAGYTVQEVQAAPAQEPQPDATQEMAELMASLAREVVALKTQVASAKAIPSGGHATEVNTAKPTTARDAAFDGFAHFVKSKMQQR
jgi:ATP-dependent Clp endopeptidase proteolytic subunit ClpP